MAQVAYDYSISGEEGDFLKHLDTAARTVWGEARGEDYNGKLAVASVIRNRVNNPGWWGHSLRGVCLKPYQFSCWNRDDPNSDRILAVDYTNRTLRECLRAVLEALDSPLDITHGATHYLVSTLEPKPNWYSRGKEICRIGKHSFLKVD